MAILRALLALFLLSLAATTVANAQEADSELSRLAIERAQLENQKLKAELAELSKKPARKGIDYAWLFAMVTGGTSFAVAAWTAQRQRRGPTDAKIHEERIKQYQAMTANTAPLAVYFPVLDGDGESRLTADACVKMGRAANEWYFNHGAMLMSVQSRDAYMRFVRGLTLASQSERPLMVPEYPQDSILVSHNKLDGYRLKLLEDIDPKCADAAAQQPSFLPVRQLWAAVLDRKSPVGTASARAAHALASDEIIAKWEFGLAAAIGAEPHQRMRDYVFLQNLSSKLRTALAEDLRSRRRPE